MELQIVQNKILEIRGHRIILDLHLAELYNVETRALKQAVKRNLERFPSDFMFELSPEEVNNMVSQNVIPSKQNFGGALPFAFTEQGVAMLSSVLRSPKAIEVNIAIMRAFVLLRQLSLNIQDIRVELESIRKQYDQQFNDVFEALDSLINPSLERQTVGFEVNKNNKSL
jgi:ORF6N domain